VTAKKTKASETATEKAASPAAQVARDDPKAVFIPPIPSAEFGLAGERDTRLPPVAFAFLVGGLLLVLLAAALPRRVWALAAMHQPNWARAVGMLLGMVGVLLGLVVLFASS
jgi:hypothetical protein